MPEWKCVAGGTVLIPTGSENHFFVILNDPANFKGYPPDCSIAVNVSSIKNDATYDNTCILKGGCHAFIKHDSYVAYRYARLETASHYEKLVQAGYCSPHEPIDSELLGDINRGLKYSIHTPKFIKQLI